MGLLRFFLQILDLTLTILGDPGAVSQAGLKRATKVFKHGRKSPWVPTLTGPFPNGQENAGSWLGTKNALYYCAQLGNSISWVLFVFIFASSWETSASRENLNTADRSSASEELACIWQSKWVGIIMIETEKMWVHSSCEYFVVVSSRDIQNSLRFTKAWSMQAWIPSLRASSPIWASEMSLARTRERAAKPLARAFSWGSPRLPK